MRWYSVKNFINNFLFYPLIWNSQLVLYICFWKIGNVKIWLINNHVFPNHISNIWLNEQINISNNKFWKSEIDFDVLSMR